VAYLIDYILYQLYNFTNRNRRDSSKRLFFCVFPLFCPFSFFFLVSRHPKIGMGVERYINKVDGNFIELTPELFEKERFFDLQAGDTHFPDLTSAGAGRYYADLKPRYEECEWLGDKVPILYKNYDGLFYRFPNVHVVYVLRDIYDIAESFETRLLDGEDNWDHDYKDAVTKWNESLIQTLKYKKKGKPIYCVDYKELFYAEYKLEKIFNPLGLEAFEELYTFYRNEKIFAQRLLDRRVPILSPDQKDYIKHNADFNACEELKCIKDSF